jgi:hypothetical protein
MGCEAARGVFVIVLNRGSERDRLVARFVYGGVGRVVAESDDIGVGDDGIGRRAQAINRGTARVLRRYLARHRENAHENADTYGVNVGF